MANVTQSPWWRITDPRDLTLPEDGGTLQYAVRALGSERGDDTNRLPTTITLAIHGGLLLMLGYMTWEPCATEPGGPIRGWGAAIDSDDTLRLSPGTAVWHVTVPRKTIDQIRTNAELHRAGEGASVDLLRRSNDAAERCAAAI